MEKMGGSYDGEDGGNIVEEIYYVGNLFSIRRPLRING